MKRATLSLLLTLAAGALVAPAANAADPVMHFDGQMKVENVCFTATAPGAPGPSQLFGERFTDGPVTANTPVIVLVHGIASSTENWDTSPTWSVARGFAAMGYVVIAYDRLGYKRSTYSGSGTQLTTSAQRNVLHQMVGSLKTGDYNTTAAGDCNGAKTKSTLKSPTAVIVGHSAGGWIVAGYPGEYHDVAAMIQADITASSSKGTQQNEASKGGSFTNPDPAHPDYFEFFQTSQNCRDFNLYEPGVVTYAANTACTPPFLDSPYGEIAALGPMIAENDASIKMIGPTIPVMLTSGDHDSTAPPSDARADFQYYKDNCGCDVSQWIIPDTAHLFQVHKSLAEWLTRMQAWLAAKGVPASGRTAVSGGSAGSTPAPVRRAARGLSAKVTPGHDRRGPFRFRTSGRLLTYAGTTPAQACTGKVSVQVKKGTRTISTRRVSLRKDCTYRSTVTFKRAKGKLRFLARFGGNAAVRATRAKTRTARAA
jgi:pimeloyl-ACP methyl ester carboxylesterase